MDFSTLGLQEPMPGYVANHYAGRMPDGTWVAGGTLVTFLNSNFGVYTTATEMKNATQDEGLQMFFADLANKGKIPA